MRRTIEESPRRTFAGADARSTAETIAHAPCGCNEF
jgi:hypothetical protein